MWLWFKRRPLVDEQTTARQAFQHPQGYARVPYGGGAAFDFLQVIRPMQAANIAVGPTHKLNDPTVTGNNAETLLLRPLSSDSALTQI